MSQGKLNGLFPPQSLSGVNSQQGMVPTPVQMQIGQFANTFGQPGAMAPAAPQNASLNPSQAGSVFTTGSYAVQPQQTQIAPQTPAQTQISGAPVAPRATQPLASAGGLYGSQAMTAQDSASLDQQHADMLKQLGITP